MSVNPKLIKKASTKVKIIQDNLSNDNQNGGLIDEKIKNFIQREKKNNADSPELPTEFRRSQNPEQNLDTEKLIMQLRTELEDERKKRLNETRRLKQYQLLLAAKDKSIKQLTQDLQAERKKNAENNLNCTIQNQRIKRFNKDLENERTLTNTLKTKCSTAEERADDLLDQLLHVGLMYQKDTLCSVKALRLSI